MKNSELEVAQSINKITQKQLKLIDGKFTKSEALDAINSVVDAKINLHLLKRLSINEGNIKDKCATDNIRITELIEDKKLIKEFLRSLSGNTANIKITSTIHISIEN
jgi:hypothetical protein